MKSKALITHDWSQPWLMFGTHASKEKLYRLYPDLSTYHPHSPAGVLL